MNLPREGDARRLAGEARARLPSEGEEQGAGPVDALAQRGGALGHCTGGCAHTEGAELAHTTFHL